MGSTFRPLEKEVQSNIIQWLSYQPEWFGWRQNAGMVVRQYKGKRHVFRSASVDGISDIIGMWDGTFVAIEVKRPNGKTTPNQDDFLDKVRAHGGIAIVADDLHTVAGALNRTGGES